MQWLQLPPAQIPFRHDEVLGRRLALASGPRNSKYIAGGQLAVFQGASRGSASANPPNFS